jgi:tetratricopeptide (TPR) repeat protein
MSVASFTELSIESVLLDAELFVKYKSPEKAMELLSEAIERSPRSISLREKMREICSSHKNLTEAASQCLALSSLYITREEFDLAYDRLQEAKLLDPRISVAPGLEAIRKARRPDFYKNRDNSPVSIRTDLALAGNLTLISLFDVVQVVENARITGLLTLKTDFNNSNVAFNEGKIVDAESGGDKGILAFRQIIELNSGTFEFSLADEHFPVAIPVSSNTNFLLDVLAQMDNEKAEKEGLRDIGRELLEEDSFEV